MTVEQIEKLLKGKSVAEVMRIVGIATDPIRMVEEGIDFTNIRVRTIAGCIRFGVFESEEATRRTDRFCVGYVTWINGPMSDLYVFTESDFTKLAQQYPPEAISGLKNQRIILAQQPVGGE